MTVTPIAPRTLRRLLLGTAAPLVLALAGQVQAQTMPTPSNPGGWVNVAPGTSVGNDSSVTVTGNRAYATWQDFNVVGGTFSVNGQVDPSWILVNRVTGTDASLISGTIRANGQVWLINQNGITATGSAVFDVGGLLLSTASIFDRNAFALGGTSWNFDNALNSIVMNGTVNASGGVVALIAPNVSVGGAINQGAGSTEALMLAAESASLSFSDTDGDLLYELNDVTVTLGADGGRVTVGTGASVTADRIVVGAVGNGGAGQILISGALSATAARGDGRDIVLMVPEQRSNAGFNQTDRVIYGGAPPQTPITTTGGTITLADGAVFSTAVGGGMEVSAAGNVLFGAITTTLDDLDVLTTGDFDSTGAFAVRGDALITATGTVTAAGVAAGRDLSLVGSAITAGPLSGGRDVLVHALTGGVTLGSAAAGDDLWIEAVEAVTTGALTAGTGADGLGVGDRPGAGLFGGVVDQIGGGDIVVRSDEGLVLGNVTAAGLGGDVRLLTPVALTTGSITAGGDVAIDAPVVVTGALSAGRDVAVWARTGALTTGAIAAGDDVVLRSPLAIRVEGGIAAGTGADVAGDADVVAAQSPVTMFGTLNDLAGGDVDLASGAGVTVTGVAGTRGGGSDVRVNAVTGIALGGAAAGRDVSLDAPTISGGVLSAGRDVAAWARTGTLTTGSIEAGDDVVLRSPLAIRIEGGIAAGTGADAAGDGDVVAAQSPVTMFGASNLLTGGDVDISSGASVTGTGVAGTTGVESDVRVNAVTGIALGGASAGRDVSLDAPTISAGTLSAGRDVAVWARTGTLTTGPITAGDDVVLRSPAAIRVEGGIAAGSGADAAGDGDVVAAQSPSSMFGAFRDLTGGDVDLSSGAGVTVTGVAGTTGVESDVRVNAVTGIALGGAAAGRDVSLDAPTISGGTLSAGRDVAVWARTGTLTTGSIAAGDDVVLRSPGAIRIEGGIAAGTGADAEGDGDVVAAQAPVTMFGAGNLLTGGDVDISSGASVTGTGVAGTTGVESDVRVNAVTGIALGGASAGRDVSLDASTISGGMLSAGRDVAVWARTGTLTTGAISAGDDVVLRSPGAIRIEGGIAAGTGADAAGDGDVVAAQSPVTMFGAGNLLTGADVDIFSGASVTATGVAGTRGVQSDVRVNAVTGIALGGASAGRDVSLDAPTISGGILTAGRDVAVWARTGTLTTGAIAAGDDVVLRSPGAIRVEGGIAAGTGADAAGDGDVVAAQSPVTMFGALNLLTGGDVDISSGASVTATGVAGTTGAQSDVRVNAVTGIALGGASAGRDVSLDAPTISGGLLTAGRDVAVWARTGTLTTGAIVAGDDVVLRASGALRVEGGIAAGGGADAAGDADVVAGQSPMTVFGVGHLLSGSDVDITGPAVTVTGATSAGGVNGDVRVRTAGAAQMGAMSAGRDVALDAGSVTTGAIGAGRDVAIRAATGEMRLGSVSAGDDVVLRAAGALTVTGSVASTGVLDEAGTADALRPLNPGTSLIAQTGQVSAGSDIDIVGASLTLGGATTAGAGSDVRLETTGATRGQLTVSGPIVASGAGSNVLIHGGDTRLGAVTARAMRVAGSDLGFSGPVAVAGDLDVFADTTGTVILGGAAGTGAFRLDNSDMQRVSAGRFSLFASTPLTATTRSTPGNVVLDTFELRPSLNTVNVYVNGQRIDVVGAVTGAGGTLNLGSVGQIEGADWRPSVVRVSGSIGTPAARLAGVSIVGDNIYIAPREGTSTVGQPDAFEQGTAPVTAYVGGPGLVAPGSAQVAADTLNLRARGRIMQRNLQGDPRILSDGRGLDVGSLVIDRLGATDLTAIDLFGQFRTAGGPVIGAVGAALTVQFGGTGPFRINYVPTLAQTIEGYRLNTCILGAGGGCAVFLVPFSQPSLPDPDELGELADPYAIVDDEAITSSGGELLWPAPGELGSVDLDDEDEQ